MADYPLVADISSHNPDDLGFFKGLKRDGVQAVIIKLTEGSNPGTAYVNPKATVQFGYARAAGLRVHAYHYARYTSVYDAGLEAQWFVTCVKRIGLERSAVLAVDVEADDVCVPATDATNAFLQTLKVSGYQNVDVYASASWFWEQKLDQKLLIAKNLWVANYGVSQPGVDHVGTWQFTSKWHGQNLDMSYDFFGFYTKGAPQMQLSATYVVRPGDSWWLIAYNNGLNMHDLARLNGTTINKMLHPGDRLRVR